MAKFVWSLNPLVIRQLGNTGGKPPLSAAELARLGIPARKIPRVQKELARLAADPNLEQTALPGLARQIARQLL